MVLLTFVVSHVSTRPTLAGKTDSPLIQGLNTVDIAGITLGPQDKSLTLKKEGQGFLLVEKDGYPASIQKINNLVTSCLDIRRGELVTDNPENHKDLGLTEDTAKNIIKFLNAEGQLITGLMVGERDDMAKGDYVRLISDDQDTSNKAYLSLNVPFLDMTAMSYIDKTLFKVQKKDIAKITVIGPGGRYDLLAGEDDKIMLENIPEGKELKDDIYEKVFTAVTDLEFSDVKKESEMTPKLDFDRSYICQLKDASIYIFQLAQKDDKTYLKCLSDYADKTPVTMKRGVVESDKELKEKEAKLLARDNSIKFNKKHGGWVYEIVNWRAVNMTRNFEDLFEDIEKKEKEKN